MELDLGFITMGTVGVEKSAEHISFEFGAINLSRSIVMVLDWLFDCSALKDCLSWSTFYNWLVHSQLNT